MIVLGSGGKHLNEVRGTQAAVETVQGPLQGWEAAAVQQELDTTYRGRLGAGGSLLTAWWRTICSDRLPHRCTTSRWILAPRAHSAKPSQSGGTPSAATARLTGAHTLCWEH